MTEDKPFLSGAKLLPSTAVIPRSPMVKARASITQESEAVANLLIWLGRSVTPVLVWPAQLIMEGAFRLQAMLLSVRMLTLREWWLLLALVSPIKSTWRPTAPKWRLGATGARRRWRGVVG